MLKLLTGLVELQVIWGETMLSKNSMHIFRKFKHYGHIQWHNGIKIWETN